MPANSDDIFTGSDDVSDFLAADGGNDTLYGYGYSDRLVGGDGNDHLYGGADFDYLYGGVGSDYLYAGDGIAVAGYVHGFKPGSHALSDFEISFDYPYSDYSDTRKAYQYITTGDVLDGGEGNDFLYASQGNNTLIGGGNLSYIASTTGPRVDDADTYEIYYDLTSQNTSVNYVNTIIDTDDQSSTDTIRMTMWERDKVQFSRRGDDLVLTGYFGGSTGIQYEGGEVVVKGYFIADSYAMNKKFVFGANEATVELAYMQSGLLRFELSGTSGSDRVIRGSNVADHIKGLAGDDLIYGFQGNDLIEGGIGNDSLYGDAGIDILYGGDGNDYLDGGAGNDGLNGHAGNDTLYGREGNDNLYGGSGSDADTYLFGALSSEGKDVVIDTDDSTVVDTLVFSGGRAPIFNRVGDDLIITGYGYDASNQITVKQFYDPSTYASNKLFKLNSSTIIKLQSENFIFRDTAASNTVYGTSFGDDIWGMAGNDTLYGYAGNDTLLGGDGADVLQGGVGNDLLYGGNGNDGLNGNAGNDTLFGQAGNDTLYGGAGSDSDTYVFYKGYGQDTVIDTDDYPTSAIDTLKFVDINSSTAKFSKVGNDLYISGYGALSDKVIVKQFYDTSVYASNKKFQFQDKTLTAAQAKALAQQASSLSSAMSSLSNSSTAAIVSSSAGNMSSVSLAASA